MPKHHVEFNNTKANLIIFGVALFLIGIVVVLVLSSSNSSNANNIQSKASVLVASETDWDFGRISMAKGIVQKIYVVKNDTTEPIIVNKVYTSCMCTRATLVVGERRAGPFGMPGHASIPTINEAIQPGEEASVEVVFDPAAHGPAGVGSIARTVYVESEDGGKLSLNFKAEVTP